MFRMGEEGDTLHEVIINKNNSTTIGASENMLVNIS